MENINKVKFIIVIIMVTFFFFLQNSFEKLSSYNDDKNNIIISPNVDPNSAEMQQGQGTHSLESENPNSKGDLTRNNMDEDQANNTLNVNLNNDVNYVEEKKDNRREILDLPPVYMPSSNAETDKNLTDAQRAELKFLEAESLLKTKQYDQAIEVYNNILLENENMEIKAKSYEKIAELYAVQKRYGSALSNAQRAFRTSPNSQREFLIARLYYITGEKDIATKRIDNILRRDFTSDYR